MKSKKMKDTSRSNHQLGMKSVRFELLFFILPSVLIAMIVLSFLGYYTSRKIIQSSVDQKMQLSLSTAVEKIEKSLAKNRKIAEALAKSVEANANVMKDANYRKLMLELLGTNSETFGGGIWFEPYAYHSDVQYFSPYCMLENGKMTYFDDYSLGEGVYYTDMDWYTSVRNTAESALWSAPYYDDYAKISMVTSSAPFYDAAGKLLGVATTDIDLTELQKMIIALQTNKDDKAFLLDAAGTYIADQDSSKLLKTTITQESNTTLSALGKTILANKQGSGSFEENGKKYRTWYAQVPEAGWIIAISSTEAQLFQEVDALGSTLTIICLITGLLVSLILVFSVQSKVVKPLKNLMHITGRIAEGDLGVQINHKLSNEIGMVFESIQKTTDRLHDYVDYISEITSVLNQMADGNLDFHLQLHYVGEFEKLKVSLEHIKTSLSQTLLLIRTSAEQVNTGASQVSGGAQALSSGASQQAATVEELSASISEIAMQAQQNLETVKAATAYTSEANADVKAGNAQMQELTEAMTNISSASKQIATITKAIEDIAFQTNILALNAAIEAARAGTAGKGFAVVADEVRSLAAKSAQAAQQTAELIERSVAAVTAGTQLTESTAQILQNVQSKTLIVNENIHKIEQASYEQSNSIEQIRMGLSQVTNVIQTTAASAEENSATSEEMSAQAMLLQEEVSRFKVSGFHGTPTTTSKEHVQSVTHSTKSAKYE